MAEPIEGEHGSPLLATQRRWIERGGLILGLEAAPSAATAVAECLGVGGLDHHLARTEFAVPSLVAKGRAIVSVLERIGCGDDLWPRVACAIDLIRAWGPVWLLEAAIGRRISPALARSLKPP